MSETNRIEYKRELSKALDIEKEVIAFLNYPEGGIIYFGIDKDGSVIGVGGCGFRHVKNQRQVEEQYPTFLSRIV